MKKNHVSILALVAIACALVAIEPAFAQTATTQQAATQDRIATSTKNMVATVHPLATDVAVAVFRDGGNAVDAAIAAALTLGVVDNHNSGIGGGCFILIRRANGPVFAIDGRETAPARATRGMFVRDGRPDTRLSQTGPLASGVPGALAAYDLALQNCGTKKLAVLLEPAAKIAEDGFPIDADYAAVLKSHAESLSQFASSREILLKPDGQPYAAGETLKQADLARTYRCIAQQGIGWFYRGEFAERTAEWMSQHAGILTRDDFNDYRAMQRAPVETTYRGYTIIGFPPPSSGGVHVAQILNILERFDLAAIHRRDESQFLHVVAEAMKRAFADRAYWSGDSDFAKVPRGLIDKGYAKELARQINLDSATTVAKHGNPPAADSDVFGKHTTHIAAVDAHGNWVAITQTINTSFGSKVIIPGTGVVMNNEMDDFAIAPGVPNAFGLIGAEANAVQPGKRPLSSMSPTIVLKDGRSIMTIGAAGGPKIITQVLLGIIRHLDLQMPLDEAIAAPRFHHQWSPNILFLEDPAADLEEPMRERGHKVQLTQAAGISQAIVLLPDGKTLQGVHDPRINGKARGE